MKTLPIEEIKHNSYNVGVNSRKFRLLLSTLLAVSTLFTSVNGFANSLNPMPSQSNARPQLPVELGAAEVIGEIIKNESVTQVAAAVAGADPTATVLVEKVKPQINAKSLSKANIQLQRSNALNTVLIYTGFGWENGVYLVAALQPGGLRWWQTALLLGFNIWYLNKISLPTGAWSKLMQTFENPIAAKLMSYNVPEDKAQIIGQITAHGGLLLAVYATMQVLSTAPNLHAGVASLTALFNIGRKTAVALASGTGFALLRRRWDALSDRDRPISRQAFTAFDSVRKLIVAGIFGPFLILTANSAGAGQFLLHAMPYLISGITGAVLYFRAEQILKRYPQVAIALERFEKITERLNEKIASCAKILRPAKH